MKQQLLYHRYCTHLLPPSVLYLYADCSVLRMPYARWGTLISALQVLMTQRGLFTPAEHEFIAAFLALQMVQAVRFIHSVGILHCDIKSGEELVVFVAVYRS